MDTKLFKKAISWAFHSEDEESIRNELGYSGDMNQVNEIVALLKKLNADYDVVHEWAK